MATRVLTLTYCDVCLGDGEEVEAVYSGTVRIDNVTKTLELCDLHQREIITPLEEILHKYGTRETAQGNVTPIYRGRGKSPKSEATQFGFECDQPGCEDGPFKAPQGLAAHLRLRHGITAADRRAAAGQ